MEAYTNSDFGACLDTRRSVSGAVLMLAKGAISWRSRMQEVTASGTSETECVCVFFPFILDIKFVGRTTRGHTEGRSNMISHPPSFCGACLNFLARRIQPFLSLVDREVEFCVLTIALLYQRRQRKFYF